MAVGAQGAAPAGTYIETAAIGVKEDLRDIIERIDPDETPLYSALPSVDAQQVLTEFLVQELNQAADNAQPEGFTAVLTQVAAFPYPEQIQVLGWMIQRAAQKPERVEIYNGLIAALHGVLKTPIPADDLKRVVNSMRGDMRH